MANYTENKSGITFTNIDWSTNGHTLADKARRSGQTEGIQDDVLNPTDREGNPITRTSFGIDAINIDWNGAQWPNSTEVPEPSTINTTGDLINAIKYASTHGANVTIGAASTSNLGGIKTGFTENQNDFGVQLNSSDQGYVHIPDVSNSNAGLMTTTDKEKLDSLSSTNNNISVDKLFAGKNTAIFTKTDITDEHFDDWYANQERHVVYRDDDHIISEADKNELKTYFRSFVVFHEQAKITDPNTTITWDDIEDDDGTIYITNTYRDLDSYIEVYLYKWNNNKWKEDKSYEHLAFGDIIYLPNLESSDGKIFKGWVEYDNSIGANGTVKPSNNHRLFKNLYTVHTPISRIYHDKYLYSYYEEIPSENIDAVNIVQAKTPLSTSSTVTSSTISPIISITPDEINDAIGKIEIITTDGETHKMDFEYSNEVFGLVANNETFDINTPCENQQVYVTYNGIVSNNYITISIQNPSINITLGSIPSSIPGIDGYVDDINFRTNIPAKIIIPEVYTHGNGWHVGINNSTTYALPNFADGSYGSYNIAEADFGTSHSIKVYRDTSGSAGTYPSIITKENIKILAIHGNEYSDYNSIDIPTIILNESIRLLAPDGEPTNDITIYTDPTKQVVYCNVSYDINGGDVMPEPKVVPIESYITLTKNTYKYSYTDGDVTISYILDGWKCSKDNKIYNIGDTYKVLSNVTFTAQWKPTPEDFYYWYIGYNQDAYEHPELFIANMYITTTNVIPTEYSKSGDNGLDISETGTISNNIIMIIPSTWSVPTIWDSSKQGQIPMSLENEGISINGISNITFNIYCSQGEIYDNTIYIN